MAPFRVSDEPLAAVGRACPGPCCILRSGGRILPSRVVNPPGRAPRGIGARQVLLPEGGIPRELHAEPRRWRLGTSCTVLCSVQSAHRSKSRETGAYGVTVEREGVQRTASIFWGIAAPPAATVATLGPPPACPRPGEETHRGLERNNHRKDRNGSSSAQNVDRVSSPRVQRK